MKSFFKTFERLFVYYFSSMGISLLVSIFLGLMMKFLLGDNYNSLVEFFISILPLMISLFVLFCIDGYRAKKLEFKLFILSELFLLVLLIIVVYLIGRAVYISGPTDYLARYFLNKSNKTFIDVNEALNQYSMGLMICAYVVLYAPIMLIAEYTGVKIRNKKFAKIYK